MTPFDDFMYLLNAVLLGEEPTIEDFILLVGTIVAFVAFILWCCFPIVPKEAGTPSQYDSRGYGRYKKAAGLVPGETRKTERLVHVTRIQSASPTTRRNSPSLPIGPEDDTY